MPAEQGAAADTGPGGANGARPSTRSPSGPQSGRLDAPQVRAMFDGIAGVYDALNTAMTAGLHHRWRARAADFAHVGPGARALDVATGTGDLALELAARVGPGGEVIGSDFAERMLDRARMKAAPADRAGGVRPRFEWGDALELPYADDSFDAATVGFGARNFSDLSRGLAEMVRVVRPGGRVVVLEITTPVKPPLSWFYELWFDRLVPLLGRATQAALGRSRAAAIGDAYEYLPNSVKRFPAPAALAAELQRAGLAEIRYVLLAGGIVAIHSGTVRSERA
jgi:demethylmenaquinone methyltransferase / 2-methoxy-6-polyprenyl-1,4-benzoquinol methylase